MATHDPETEVKLKLVRLFIRFKLEETWPRMEEYIANGARLGWLLDPINNCAVIYRHSQLPERIDGPGILSGDPVLRGFEFDFREILTL